MLSACRSCVVDRLKVLLEGEPWTQVMGAWALWFGFSPISSLPGLFRHGIILWLKQQGDYVLDSWILIKIEEGKWIAQVCREWRADDPTSLSACQELLILGLEGVSSPLVAGRRQDASTWRLGVQSIWTKPVEGSVTLRTSNFGKWCYESLIISLMLANKNNKSSHKHGLNALWRDIRDGRVAGCPDHKRKDECLAKKLKTLQGISFVIFGLLVLWSFWGVSHCLLQIIQHSWLICFWIIICVSPLRTWSLKI